MYMNILFTNTQRDFRLIKQKQLITIFAISLGFICTGCVNPVTETKVAIPPQEIKSVKRFDKQYVLAAGDAIEVYVVNYPEVSRVTTIRPDGRISLPLIGDIEVAGNTFNELQRYLTQHLSQRLNKPEVYVIAVDIRKPMVYIVGEAIAPRPISLREASTAAQAIAIAGGMNSRSSKKHVTLIRLDEEGYLTAKPISSTYDGQAAPYVALQQTLLEADDILFIPESNRSQFVRAINDYVNQPLNGINSILGTWVNFKLIEEIDDNN